MNKASGTTTRQTLFESLLVYKKAEIKKEYSIIYGNGRIRNLNAFDKITRSISNILGFQKLNELNEKLSREDAKLNITNKLKGNLFESKETLTNIRDTNQRAWNLDKATQNFFEKMNGQIKEKKMVIIQITK